VSNPNVVAYWTGGKLTLEDFERRRRMFAAPVVIEVLDAFRRPRDARSIGRIFPDFAPASVRQTVAELRRTGFLLPVGAGTRRELARAPASAWPNGFSAAYYHFANRDPAYTETEAAYRRFLRARLAEAPQPPPYKTYSRAPRVQLPDTWPDIGETTLARALQARRTVRSFVRQRVPLSRFAAILQGTWGQTGWIEGGPLGKLIAKTSPSAGARHPIECYVFAFRVARLKPGLYHYAVKSNRLERLRAGDQTAHVLDFLADCDWLRNAAFVCVMTAVTERLFWKYPAAGAYRLFFLDAGHLAQTFVLLATALGLGPFTTAAIRHSRIEKLLGIDGIREFPLYVCAAGVPDEPLLPPEALRPVEHHVQGRRRVSRGRDD
jgi:SagB-type dehydrogenase family enzyme